MNDYMRYQMMRQRMTSKENHDRPDAGPHAPEYYAENRSRDSRGRFTSSGYDGYTNYGNAFFAEQEHPGFEGYSPEYRNAYMLREEHMGARAGNYDHKPRLIGFNGMQGGMSENSEDLPQMDKEMSEEWTRMMRNEDGSKGAHWKMEQTNAILKQRGYKHTETEWYAVMNAMFSDFYGVAKKYGLAGNPEFFADLANAWLNDRDAVDNKAAVYFCEVVKH